MAFRSQSQSPDRPPQWWTTRAAVLVTGILLTLIAAIAYAGPGRQLFAVTLAYDGILLLAWLAGGAGWGVLVLVMLFGRRTPARATQPSPPEMLLVLVSATALGLGLMSLGLLGLGMLGKLNGPVAFGLIVLGIAAGISALALLSNRRRDAQSLASPWRAALKEWWLAAARWGWASLVVVPFASIALVGTMVPAGLLWKPEEPHGYDVVEYHLQVPREWYEAGRIRPLRHNVYSFFPMNVEMHYLLAMHLEGGPWDGMFLAQLMHLAMVALAVLAGCGFAKRLAPHRANVVLATVAIGVAPWLPQLGAIAYNEGGFLLFGTLAIGWALRATVEEGDRIRRFLLAGAFAGFACGVKLTAVPEVLVAVPAISLIVLLAMKLRGARMRGRDWLGPVLFGLVGLLLFCPWLIRDAMLTGNPVFPEGMPLLGHGYFSDVQVERWERAHHAPPEWSSPGARLGRFWSEILAGWQFGYVLIPLAVAAIAARIRSPAAWFLGGMLLVLVIFWLGPTHLQGRFFVLGLPLACMLAAMGPWRWWAPVGFLLVLATAPANFAMQLHPQFMSKVYEGPDPEKWIITQTLANPNISWLNSDGLEGLPQSATLVLIGDAKAFWYPIPMTRLRYRTVFDVDTSNGRGLLEAWEGHDAPKNAWRLYDPFELERFERTYPPLPPMPKWLREKDGPYMVPPK